MTPQAKLLRPSCRRVQQGEVFKALGFTVTVETQGLVGDQLIYEVSLYNAAAKPIKSTDGRYQNKAGAVAACKTLMVLESPCTFKDLQLSIPADELQIRKGDWPASARFRLYNVAGECLAQGSCVVPPEPAIPRPATRPTQAAPATRPGAAPRKDRPPATQPTTQPTGPRQLPPEQKPAPRGRPTRAGDRANSGGAMIQEVSSFAALGTLAATAEGGVRSSWRPHIKSGQLSVTRRSMDPIPATPRAC